MSDDDVLLKIGADNSGLKASAVESESVVDQMLSMWRDRIDSERLVPNVDFSPVEDGFNSAASAADDVTTATGKWTGKLTSVVTKFGKILGFAGLITTAVKGLFDWTEKIARSASGYNDQLERSEKLLKKISEAREDANKGAIESALKPGGEEAIRKLQFLEKNARLQRDTAAKRLSKAEEAEKALLLKPAGDTRPGVFGEEDATLFGLDKPKNDNSFFAFLNNRSGFIGQFFDGKFNSQLKDEAEAARKELEEAEKAHKRFLDALKSERKRQSEEAEEAAEKQAQAQEKVNKKLKHELSLQKEKKLRADGNIMAADAVRDRREYRANIDRFGDEQAALDVFMARRDAREAEAAKKIRELEAKAREEAEKRRIMLEQKAARKQPESGDSARLDRRSPLTRRLADLRAEQRQPLGGIDKGLFALSDRIANAAASPDKTGEKIEQLKMANEKAATEAQRQRTSQEGVLKEVVSALENLGNVGGMT